MKQETTGCSGISWTISKSFACHSRHITTPAPHHSIFTGQMPFLTSNQQCQSTKGNYEIKLIHLLSHCIHKILFNSVQICSCHYQFSGPSTAYAFSALTLLVGRQEKHLACKKFEWWCAGMVICLERGANDLHIVTPSSLASLKSRLI